MPIHPTPPPGTDLITQHRSIRARCTALARADALGALHDALEALRADLRAHFELEESPHGRATVLGEAALNEARRMEALFEEHPELLGRLEALSGRARELGAEVQALCEGILTHEAAERALFADALYAEGGGRG